MSKSLRAVLYAIGLGVALGLLFLAFVLPNRESGPDGVDGNFSVGGVSRDDALGALRDLEVRLANSPIRIKVEGTSFELIPATIGFDFDEESVLDSALEATSPDSVIEAAEEWDGDGGHAVSLSIMATFDEAALFSLLDRYDLALEGPFEGGIALEGTTPIAKYSRPGLVIDRLSAGPLISSALVQRPRPESVTLNIIEETPILSVAAVDAALDEAILLLGGRITLTRSDPDVTLFLSVEQLARALMTRVEEIPSPHMVVTFDPVRFDDYLHPVRAGFESPPVDARFIIDDDENITIIPGFPGARIDTDLVVEAAEQAARRATRTTVLPLDTGVAPTISTDYLLSLGVKGKISEFTTEHPCCRPRVNNIQLFADAIDGRMVLPGEVVSLNETVGKRTPEKGYRPAPTIIKGEITDTVGGGVSQFATTFYNAVFWAGLEIIEHQPHSYYFSRYPEGIEATISWQKPDLVFRNDTRSAVVIDTSYTGTSITVKFFGDNSDREVKARVSGRFGPTEFPTEYFPNPEVMPWEEEVEVQQGADGWSVEVTRDLEFSDGSTTSQDWTVRYRPWPRHVEVHPCLLPEDSEDYTGEECPVEPTTTTPPTTAPPDESTTSTTAAPVPDSGEESTSTTAGA